MPVTFARLCLGPYISGFLRENPRVSLDLVLSDAYVDLVAERIDVAVRIGTPDLQPQLIVRKLAEHRRYVVASHEYLERHGTPTAPEELTQHDCLRFAHQAGPQRWSFLRGDDEVRHVEVQGRLAANNSDMLREAVLDGQGIALLAEWLIREDVRAGRCAGSSRTTRSILKNRVCASMRRIYRIAGTPKRSRYFSTFSRCVLRGARPADVRPC